METHNNIGAMIVRDEAIRGGRARIAGTGITVRRIIGWYQLGHAPEEIVRELPHVSLAQVFAALSYYHANRDEIDGDLEEENKLADKLTREQVRPAG